MLRFILTFLFTATCAQAAGVALSVDGAADYALVHNPTLAAARLRIEEARGRWQQSGRLANPELEIEFTRIQPGPEGSLTAALMQRFPLTARLRYERAVSRAELAAVEAEVRDGERKIAAEAQALAVQIIASRGQRALRARQQENSLELSRFLLKRVESGEASGVDAAQVELESQQLELEVLQLTATELEFAGELRALLGVTGDVSITGELPAVANKTARSAAAIAERPDVRAAEHRSAAAQAAAQQQRASRWEDVGVGAIYGADRELDTPEPLEKRQIFGVQMSIPLPLWNNNAGRIREAEAVAARTALEAKAVHFMASNEVSGARGDMIAHARLVTALDSQLLPKAAQIEEQIRQYYSTGQALLTDVLRARDRRLGLQRQRLDALRDYHLARVRYEAGATMKGSAR
jgi:cobalt-zinc-cadmium efflux system outer membrane protein